MSVQFDIFDNLDGFNAQYERRKDTHKSHRLGAPEPDVVTISRVSYSDSYTEIDTDMLVTVDLKTGQVSYRKQDGTWTTPEDQFVSDPVEDPYVGVFNLNV